MVRTMKIDKGEVKRRLLAGEGQTPIASDLGCKRQYISLIKKEYERKGVKFPQPQYSLGVAKVITRKPRDNSNGFPTFEEIETLLEGKQERIQAVIDIIKNNRAMSAELQNIRPLANAYTLWKEAKDSEEKKTQKRKDLAYSYKVALDHGDVNPPVGLPGKAKISADFTEHIFCAPPDSASPININDYSTILTYEWFNIIPIDTMR